MVRIIVVENIFGLILFYCKYSGVYGVATYVIMATAFLRVRQQSLLDRFNELNRELDQLKCGKKATEKFALLWSQHLLINEKVNSLCRDIEESAAYWIRSLTVLMVGYVTIQCYFIYMVAYVSETPIAQKLVVILAIIEIEIALFILIDQCARVVKLNRSIEVANRRFFHLFLLKNGFSGLKGNCALLKVKYILVIKDDL